jgi:hypothetical protein
LLQQSSQGAQQGGLDLIINGLAVRIGFFRLFGLSGHGQQQKYTGQQHGL